MNPNGALQGSELSYVLRQVLNDDLKPEICHDIRPAASNIWRDKRDPARMYIISSVTNAERLSTSELSRLNPIIDKECNDILESAGLLQIGGARLDSIHRLVECRIQPSTASNQGNAALQNYTNACHVLNDSPSTVFEHDIIGEDTLEDPHAYIRREYDRKVKMYNQRRKNEFRPEYPSSYQPLTCFYHDSTSSSSRCKPCPPLFPGGEGSFWVNSTEDVPEVGVRSSNASGELSSQTGNTSRSIGGIFTSPAWMTNMFGRKGCTSATSNADTNGNQQSGDRSEGRDGISDDASEGGERSKGFFKW